MPDNTFYYWLLFVMLSIVYFICSMESAYSFDHILYYLLFCYAEEINIKRTKDSNSIRINGYKRKKKHEENVRMKQIFWVLSVKSEHCKSFESVSSSQKFNEMTFELHPIEFWIEKPSFTWFRKFMLLNAHSALIVSQIRMQQQLQITLFWIKIVNDWIIKMYKCYF